MGALADEAFGAAGVVEFALGAATAAAPVAGVAAGALKAVIPPAMVVAIWPVLCLAMLWPMAGTLVTMASARAPESVFCCWRDFRTTGETPSWSKTAFLATRLLMVVLTWVPRLVAVCCRDRASVRERASVPVMVVVAVLITDAPLVWAVRRVVRELGSVAETP